MVLCKAHCMPDIWITAETSFPEGGKEIVEEERISQLVMTFAFQSILV